MGCKRLLDAWHSSILLHRRVCQRCAPFPNERHCTELLEVLVSVWCLNVGWRRCGLGYVGDRCTSWGLACSKNTAFVSLAASLPNHQTLEGLAGRVTLPQDATRYPQDATSSCLGWNEQHWTTNYWQMTGLAKVFGYGCHSISMPLSIIVFAFWADEPIPVCHHVSPWVTSSWQGFPSLQNQLTALRARFGSLTQPVISPAFILQYLQFIESLRWYVPHCTTVSYCSDYWYNIIHVRVLHVLHTYVTYMKSILIEKHIQ